ncbi:MAG: hypothetical protein KA059_05300 [Elusimicrobiales bacterium]|nr:hypothetical protein [Elusimicrobiales bacterium]NLH39813.1 hypothetical protein [Elusimicrobiota bacterium]
MEKKTKVIAGGVALSAVAAAAIYFLAGEKNKKNREKIAQWGLEMKTELLKKMKDMKDVTKEEYDNLVDELTERYERVKKVSSKDLKVISKDLKGAWQHIQKEIK